MRHSRWAVSIVVLAVLFVAGFFGGAGLFKKGPVLDAVRSSDAGGGRENTRSAAEV